MSGSWSGDRSVGDSYMHGLRTDAPKKRETYGLAHLASGKEGSDILDFSDCAAVHLEDDIAPPQARVGCRTERFDLEDDHALAGRQVKFRGHLGR